MEWVKSKTSIILAGCLALVGFQGYSLRSVRSTLEERVASLEREVLSSQSRDSRKISALESDLDVVTQRIGITAQELQQAHQVAAQLKQENARTAERLRNELSAKADATAVSEFREEAANLLNEVQLDTTTMIGAVTSEVQVVRTDLDETRQELASSRKDLTDVKTQIARNAGELAELRRRGERDYVEFDLPKGSKFQRVADVGIQLKNTDTKKQKYTVMILADDERFEKKDRAANEPVTFLVGPDRLRYEFVVNYVDKNRIRGYLSTPKDRTLSAEGPKLRGLE